MSANVERNQGWKMRRTEGGRHGGKAMSGAEKRQEMSVTVSP